MVELEFEDDGRRRNGGRDPDERQAFATDVELGDETRVGHARGSTDNINRSESTAGAPTTRTARSQVSRPTDRQHVLGGVDHAPVLPEFPDHLAHVRHLVAVQVGQFVL